MRFLILLCLLPALTSGAIDFFKRFIDCKLGNGLHPNPTNKCSIIYFACVGGDLKKLHCDTGKAYHKDRKLCMPMTQVPDCASVLPPPINNPVQPLPPRPQPRPILPPPPPRPILPPPRPPVVKPFPFNRPPAPAPVFNPPVLPKFQPRPIFNPPVISHVSPIRKSNVNFNCAGKPDGDYSSGCSNVYYSCSGGEAVERNCPRKVLKYDSKKKQCDLKEYVAECGGRPRVIPVTTRGPPVKDNGLCVARKDGVFPDPKNKCSNQYLTCAGGFGRYVKCPHKFKFDVTTGQCMSGLHVPACGGRPTTPAPLTTVFPIQSDPSYQCQGKPDGDYAHPRHKCSHLFYSCVGGKAIPRSCGSEFLAFDGKKCENRAHARTCGGVPRPVTKPPQPPRPNPNFSCKGLPDGLHADKRSRGCSGTFYSCNNGFVAELHCYTNLFFDIQSQRCIQKAYISACGGRSTQPQETKPPVSADVAFDCDRHGQGSHSRGCSHEYIVCDSGRAILMTCPAALKFDKETEACESKQYIRECGGKPRPPTKPPVINNPPRVNFDCTNKPDGQYRDNRQRCAPHFYSCASEIANIVKCPKGMFYDSTIKACNLKEHTPDCGGSPPKPYVPPPKPQKLQRISLGSHVSNQAPVILPAKPSFQPPAPVFNPPVFQKPAFQPPVIQKPAFQPPAPVFNPVPQPQKTVAFGLDSHVSNQAPVILPAKPSFNPQRPQFTPPRPRLNIFNKPNFSG